MRNLHRFFVVVSTYVCNEVRYKSNYKIIIRFSLIQHSGKVISDLRFSLTITINFFNFN